MLHRATGAQREVTITSIEKFKQGKLQTASAGLDSVGLQIAEVTHDDVGVGDTLEK
jgi:hypothetical protein